MFVNWTTLVAVYFFVERNREWQVFLSTVLHYIEFNTEWTQIYNSAKLNISEDGVQEDTKMNNMAQTMQLRGVVQKNTVTSAGQTQLYKYIIMPPLNIARVKYIFLRISTI